MRGVPSQHKAVKEEENKMKEKEQQIVPKPMTQKVGYERGEM